MQIIINHLYLLGYIVLVFYSRELILSRIKLTHYLK